MTEHDRQRPRGRVHAHVRLRPPLAPAAPPAPCWATRATRHASRHQFAARSGRTPRPAPLRPRPSATRHARASSQQNSSGRPSNLTPGITRRGGPVSEDDKRRPAVGCMPLLDCGPPLAHLPPCRAREMTFNSRHASRDRLASRLGHTSWPASLQPSCPATGRCRTFIQQ
jgi:hypothetical protein